MAEQSDLLSAAFPTEHREADEQTWKLLRFLNIYRLSVGVLLVTLFHLGQLPQSLGGEHPFLFYSLSVGYVVFAGMAGIAIYRRLPAFETQVYLHLSVDIVVITLLMHASGGMQSGLGTLLVVTTASAGMLTAGRTAGFFAASATLALLVEQVYARLVEGEHYGSYSLAGMLGATLFATAILARVLAQRIRESEALADRRGVDLANMAKLTEYIIQQMDMGVLVVDTHGTIRLTNGAAWRLLGKPAILPEQQLATIAPALAQRLERWLHSVPLESTETLSSGAEVIPTVIRMGEGGFLIFIEDATTAAEHAQQLKLAALGRLTASIAHEVRNPLGAISHAGALLAESDHLMQSDRRLTEIIAQQVQRVNAIIESVLQLGRRDQSRPETIHLASWLERFAHEFAETAGVSEEQVTVSVAPADLTVRFDPNHLRQILWNLVQNGFHHGRAHAHPQVNIAVTEAGGRVHIDVIDNGPGVAEEYRGHLFEPFFTTEANGTGLGLYFSRELAQCNRARLDYLPTAATPGVFRLSLSLPEQAAA